MINYPQKIKVEPLTETSSRFIIEPLYPGYGITIGNSLRRILYSSLEGAAITKVRIKGVQHEFSLLENIREDVIAILLNLKQVRFKMFTSESQEGILKVRGEKEVKAGDFEFPGQQVEVVNKDFTIAEITDPKGSLEMEVIVEKGLGFKSADQIREEEGKDMPAGFLPVDAIFSPVRRVKYEVENVRFGRRTDYDKLILEVTTDGTLTPEKAFTQAIEILEKQLNFIRSKIKGEEALEDEDVTRESSEEEREEVKDVKALSIEELKLPQRVANVLLENKVKTIGGLLRKSKESLLNMEGLGEKGLKEIEKALKNLGLSLKE